MRNLTRPQFIAIAVLLVFVVMLLAYIADLESRNTELRRFIAGELARTREQLREAQDRLGEVDAATTRIMGELGVEERQGK